MSDKNKLELGAGMNLFAILLLVQDCRLVCKFFNKGRVKSLDKSEQQKTGNSFFFPAACIHPKEELTKAEPAEHTCERYAAQQKMCTARPLNLLLCSQPCRCKKYSSFHSSRWQAVEVKFYVFQKK